MGVGAMTDFGPLVLAIVFLRISYLVLQHSLVQWWDCSSMLFAIFMDLVEKQLLQSQLLVELMDLHQSSLLVKLGQTDLLGPIAVAAYSYIALVQLYSHQL